MEGYLVGFSFSDVVGTIAVWSGGCAVLCIIGLWLMGVSCSVLPFSWVCCGFGLCVSLGVLVTTWVFVVCCGVCMRCELVVCRNCGGLVVFDLF